jgi:hypothetical protein
MIPALTPSGNTFVPNPVPTVPVIAPQKALVPWMFSPLGMLSFAFSDADHKFIDAFTAAGNDR